jgi:hypothetical protein
VFVFSDASRLLVRELSWGSPLSDQILPPYDMVVASDVIYELINIDDLIKSISDLCGAHTVVYLAYRCRFVVAFLVCVLSPFFSIHILTARIV